jgi:serine/threonine protein kinase
MPLEGQRIDRYHILRLLGGGGMGDVYLAEDPLIGQQVAIKIIRSEPSAYPDATSPKEAAELFYREVKSIGKLDHPHILPLFDYGEEQIGEMAVIYLVMPYRPEGSLAKWLAQRTQNELLPPREIARLVHQAADALQHAHDHRIIHQDVKPSNFLIRERKESPGHPDLLLSDFGIARLVTTTAGVSQTTRGTPTYMAPEQCLGHAVPASDQYALAIMTYELLTGRPPFLGGPMQVMFQQIHDMPHPPGSLNPSLSQEVNQVLMRALSKQSSERFDSISAFAAAFEQAVQNLPQPDYAMPAPSSPTRSLYNPPPAGEMHAELAISVAEAQMGTTRTITLPGGQTLSVKVPAGVQDGYVVRLDSQGSSSTGEDTKNVVLLTIRIKQASGDLSPASSLLAQSTEMLPRDNNSPASAVAVSNQDESTLDLVAARAEQSTVIPETPANLADLYDASTAVAASPEASPTKGAIPTEPAVPHTIPTEVADPSETPPATAAVSPDAPTAGPIPTEPAVPHTIPTEVDPAEIVRDEASEISAKGTALKEPAVLHASPPGERVSPDAPAEDALTAAPATPAPARKRTYPRWVLVALPVLVLLLIVGGVLAAVANPFRSSLSIAGNSAAGSLATVTITPASKKLANTYTITAVTTAPDASKHQVAARFITSQTSPQSQTVPATGTSTIPATHASGILTLYNYSTSSSVTLTAGTDIPNMQAVAVDMILDGNVTVPPATDPTNPPTGTVPAHVAQAGTIGNLPTVDNGSGGFYYCTNCSNGNVKGWEIENDSPFSGGKDAQTVTVVQQSDINSAASSIEASNAPNPQQVLQGQVHPGEQLVGTPQCTPQETSDHQPGDQASSVTVTVTFTCTGEVYDRDAALSLAAKLLSSQAATQLGTGYSLVGKIVTAVTQTTVTSTTQGTIAITTTAQGTWSFQFSAAQKQALASLIAGKTQQQAQALLQAQAGVQQATIKISGGGNTLPADPHQISIVVQAIS